MEFLPYFLENKPRPIFLFELKFFGLLLNRPISEVLSEERKYDLEKQQVL